ncbi:hypothetical protein pA_gene0064 [Aeromonas phage phiA008]|nr:hypothetical protein pA_gene0064 [Aeromonas phage phiA008]
MRLRLTDENWQWLRSTDHYSRQLQLSDVNGTHLSVAEQYAALFRATEVAYNNATLLRPKSLVSLADKPYVNMQVLAKSDVATADYSKFSFTRVEKDVATPADKQMFSFSYINKDVVNLSERLSFDVLFGVVAEFATSVDVLWSHFTTAQKSSSVPTDYSRFQFTAGVSDSIVTGEFCSFALSFLLKSPAAAVDFVQCTFQAGLFDSVAGADRVSVTISTLVRDSVTAASGFFLSGRAFQNTASSVAATDVFYSTFTDPQPDSVGASDFIEIGIRYVVDFYFGGMSFGGSPFGGRTI